MISDRPAEVEDRAVPGYWEGDLIMGKGMRAIGTLVERSTRFVMLVRLPTTRRRSRQARPWPRRSSPFPTELRRSLTWDQGKEMNEDNKSDWHDDAADHSDETLAVV